jgi:predicted amidohydrolase
MSADAAAPADRAATAPALAAAQVAVHVGDVAHNVAVHVAAAALAAEQGAALVVFPELSLTAYEPRRAAELVVAPDDDRLLPLSELAWERGITIVAGAPLASASGKPHVGALVFEPGGVRTYRKMHLGSSEPDYFTAGDVPLALEAAGLHVGLAICADTARPSHPQAYVARGAQAYAAGVMLTREWYDADARRLHDHARDFRLLTLMANHGASTGTHVSVGRSAIWAPGGALLALADGDAACLLLARRDDDGWHGRLVPLEG